MKWKSNHPKSGLSTAFDGLEQPASEERLREILLAFAQETRNNLAVEKLQNKHEEVDTHKLVNSKRYVDYARACLHYRLEPDNITTDPETGKETDHTLETLNLYERLQYLTKEKNEPKARAIVKKHKMPQVRGVFVCQTTWGVFVCQTTWGRTLGMGIESGSVVVHLALVGKGLRNLWVPNSSLFGDPPVLVGYQTPMCRAMATSGSLKKWWTATNKKVAAQAHINRTRIWLRWTKRRHRENHIDS